MSPDNGMLGRDPLASSYPPSVQTIVDLLDTRVHRLQTVQPLTELRRQPSVRLRHVGEESITSAGRSVEKVQESRAGRLLLEGHVRMPGHGVCTCSQKLGTTPVVRPAVNEVNLGEAFGGSGGLMDMVSAKVATKVKGFFNREMGKVLVAEGWETVSLHQ
jgi:hypothetical protein